MLWNDPIVEEVRKARDTYAKQFNYDLDRIYQDLKEKENKSNRMVIPSPLSVNTFSPQLEKKDV